MSTVPRTGSDMSELTWDVATLFPPQGQWTDGDYLNLTNDLTQLVELADGHLDILEMPSTSHQQIVLKLMRQLADFVDRSDLGIALMAPLRVQLRPGLFREPDVVFALKEHSDYVRDEFWTGADLVFEVVSSSPKSRRRDLHDKRHEYAQARITEYWIVDPMNRNISVLQLDEFDPDSRQYKVTGEFSKVDFADSGLLAGFTVSVNEIFGIGGDGSSEK